MATKGRVTGPEFAGPVPLQPGGIPGDTYTPPPAMDQDNALGRLADNLSHFNSALGQWGTSAVLARKKEAEARDQAHASGLIAGKTREEWNDDVRAGRIPRYADPVANLAIAKHSGSSAAEAIRDSIERDIRAGKFNLSDPNLNLDEVITKAARPTLEEGMKGPWGSGASALWGRGYGAGFKSVLEKYRDSLQKRQDEARTKYHNEQRDGATEAVFSAEFERGLDPKQTQERVRAVYPELSKTFGFRFEEMDQRLLPILKRYASRPETVEQVSEVLFGDRTSPDGQKLPPLAANPRYSKEVHDLTDLIMQTRKKAFIDREEKAAEDRALEAYRRQDGSIAFVTPLRVQLPPTAARSPEFVNIGEKARENGALRYFTWSQIEAAQSKRPLNMVVDREVRVAQAANITVPHLRDALNNAVPAAMNGSFVTDKATRDKVLGAYSVYSNLSANNPAWMEDRMGLNKPTKEFFRAMDIGVKYMGMDVDQAMTMASQVVRNPEAKENPDGLQRKMEDVRSSARNVVYHNGWMSYVFGNATPYNGRQVVERVEAVASLLARHSGIEAEEAIKVAKKYVAETSITVNGSALTNVSFMPKADAMKAFDKWIHNALPEVQKQYPDLVQGILPTGVTANTRSGIDLTYPLTSTKVAVADMGDGRFMLINRDTAQPIALPKIEPDGTRWRAPMVITRQELIAIRDAEKREEDQRTVGDAEDTRRNLDANDQTYRNLERRFQNRRR